MAKPGEDGAEIRPFRDAEEFDSWRSIWSEVNVAKVEALTRAGRMRPPGVAEVEAAQADGRWAAAYRGAEGQRRAR
jgi:hypothetical protein